MLLNIQHRIWKEIIRILFKNMSCKIDNILTYLEAWKKSFTMKLKIVNDITYEVNEAGLVFLYTINNDLYLKKIKSKVFVLLVTHNLPNSTFDRWKDNHITSLYTFEGKIMLLRTDSKRRYLWQRRFKN
jgi:hypothetical protein